MICVKDLLEVPSLSELKVIAGQNGLARQINTVTLLDAPDGPKWLKGGEFVLTSAYIFDNNYELLEEYIAGLVEKEASGLGIKSGRYLGELPDRIIDFAGSHQFPVVQIPYQLVWTDIISPFYQLKYSLNDHKKPVIIEPDMILSLFEASRWGAKRLLLRMTELFSIAVAVCKTDRTLLLDNAVQGISRIEKVLSSIDRFPERRHPVKVKKDGYIVGIFCLPLSYRNEREYLAVASEQSQDIEEIEKLISLLESLSNKDVLALRERSDAYRAFLSKVISGDITEEEIKAFEQSRTEDKSGIIYSGIMILASEAYPGLYQVFKDAVESYGKKSGMKISSYLVDYFSNQQAVVLYEIYSPEKVDINVWIRGMIPLFNACFSEEQQGQIGFSRIAEHLKDVVQLYDQARGAIRLGNLLWPEQHCYFYVDYCMYDMLEKQDLHQINFEDCLLLQKDKSTMAFSPLETAEVYIESGNYKRAAAKLFVHENTLRYRINKINELINIDLENPAEAYQFLTKLKLWKIHNAKDR